MIESAVITPRACSKHCRCLVHSSPALFHSSSVCLSYCHTPDTMVLRSLFLVALSTSFNLGGAFLLPSVHQVVLPKTSPAIVRHQHDTDSGKSVLLAAAPTAAGGSSSTATAKKSFLQNLERKRAGEEVASSVLNADLQVLRSTPTQSSTTTVDNTRSWKGTWEICYAPHIQTLAKVSAEITVISVWNERVLEEPITF